MAERQGAAPTAAPSSVWQRVLPVVLFVSYPLLVHTGIVFDQLWLRWIALCVLYAGFFARPLIALRAPAWIGGLLFGGLTGELMLRGGGMYALYVAPLALQGMVFSVFASSLRPGQQALVTRIADAAHGPLTPELRAHTRQVTWVWAVSLAAMFITTLVLSVTGPATWWSLFTNLISYLVMGLLFVGEYAYRRWRFPEQQNDGLVAHLRLLITQGRRLWGRP